MRPPSSRRVPLAVVLVGLVVAPLVAGGGGAGAAPRQAPGAAPDQVSVMVLATPAERGPSSSRAHVPSGAAPPAATTSTERSVLPATPEGTPQSVIGDPESVIGADGRERLPVPATSAFPLSAIGQIEFRFSPTDPTYICTGYLIDRNSLLTAGHCSFRGGQDQAIQSATFFPGRNRGQGVVTNPFGSCAVTSVWGPDQWRLQGKPAHDYSVQQLAEGCDFAETAGSFGLFTLAGTNAFAGRRLRVEGYPGDKGYGSRWKMVGEVQRNSINTLHYPMDTSGGQSGSPLFKWNRPSCGGPCSAGVHAYGAAGNPLTNSGPMMTNGRIGAILAVAAQNGD